MSLDPTDLIANLAPPPRDPVGIVAPSAMIAQMKSREFKEMGLEKSVRVLFPNMQIAGLRFSNILVSDRVHNDITRGSPMTRRWFNEDLTMRLDKGGQVIILP